MAGSSEVERAVAGSGERELSPLQSMDDPCTARLRLRRLLAYLRGHGYGELYLAARRIMPVIFHTKDLSKKVKEGKRVEAAFYINSFAPFSMSGYEVRLLMKFLTNFNGLDNFARRGSTLLAGTYFWNWLLSMYKKPVLDKYPCFATLVEDVVTKRDDHARAFFDWQLVRNKAAKVAKEMAYKTPELRGRIRYPRGRSDLYNIVPFGSRRCVKKNFGRKQSAALAHYYLQKKKRSQETMLYGESLQKMLHGEPMMALFETSLEAGRRSIVKDGCAPHLPKDVPFAWTKTFRLTATPRSSVRRQPERSFDGLLPPGYLNAAVVRESHQRLSANLDHVINSVMNGLPVGVTLLQFQPLRNNLDAMFALGNQPNPVPANAIMHMDMLPRMRARILEHHHNTIALIPDLGNASQGMLTELNQLEGSCMQALDG